jgi:solute carrier family 35 (UDP-sugar transporter), member A1/2/3
MKRYTVALLATLLCVVVSSESTLIKWVKLNETIHPPSEHLIILAEIIKGMLCAMIYYTTIPRGTPSELIPLNGNPQPRLSSTWALAVPALIYTVSNNITFMALSLLSSSMFSLLVNLKIPFTGISARLFLNTPMTLLGWIALSIMSLGSAVACIKTGSITLITWSGLMLMLVYAACSATAAVYMEYITRHVYRNESLLLQNVKFSLWGILFNVIVSTLRGSLFSWHLEDIHMLSVFSMVLNGLVTSMVIKYAGSIVKTYAAAFAALVTAFMAWCIWGQILTWNYYLGAVICCSAIQLYAYDKLKKL